MGQVLIEVTLAAAGVVVLAFVAARVAQWLNVAMVERNANFQTSRVAAAFPGQSLLRMNQPNDIHLIGPTADRASAAPPSPAAVYDRSCPSGQASYTAASEARAAAQANMVDGDSIRTLIAGFLLEGRKLVEQANAMKHLRVLEICPCEAQLKDLQYKLWTTTVNYNTCKSMVDACNFGCFTCSAGCATDCNALQTACAAPFTFCVAGCSADPASCNLFCDALYSTPAECSAILAGCFPNCQASRCGCSCGNCDALKAEVDSLTLQVAAKQIECDNLRIFRQGMCNALPPDAKDAGDCQVRSNPNCEPKCADAPPGECSNPTYLWGQPADPWDGTCPSEDGWCNPEQLTADAGQRRADQAKVITDDAANRAYQVWSNIGAAENFERDAVVQCGQGQ